MQKELSDHPEQPRADEYARLLIRYRPAMVPDVHRKHDGEMPVNHQESGLDLVLSAESSNACRERGFGLYADSLDDKDLDKRLLVERVVEQISLDELEKLWREHAKNGGPIPLSIRKHQRMLKSVRQERHKIGTIQLYRRNIKLRNVGQLSDEQYQALREQIHAYEIAKHLQLTLSAISKELDFRPLCVELGEWIAEYNQKSIVAAQRVASLQKRAKK